MATITSNLPLLDMSTSTTGCCPIFNPDAWDSKVFTFTQKLFIKDYTVNFLHIPLNMSSVMARMQRIATSNNVVADDFILLSRDLSSWRSEHLYAIPKAIPSQQIVALNGTYYSKVYEGNFKEAGTWYKDLEATMQQQDIQPKKLFFYYTTCPKCAKVYGKNYVVGFAQIS